MLNCSLADCDHHPLGVTWAVLSLGLQKTMLGSTDGKREAEVSLFTNLDPNEAAP
jgi:hypothetical protein